MKFRLPLAIVALLLGAVSIPLQAATVFIANHSFEDATNTSWLRASDGTTSIVRTFGVIASAVHDTPPDGSDTINYSNGQESHQVYQVLATTLAANTTYTLTVDIGDRTDHGPGAPVLRLGTVSGIDDGTTGDSIANHFYGENLLTGTHVLELVGTPNSDIVNSQIKKDAPPAQLYDQEADVNQTTNLYNKHPEIVTKMKPLLADYKAGRR